MDRARTQDHLARIERERFSGADRVDARHAAPVEPQRRHTGAWQDREVLPRAHFAGQVAPRARRARVVVATCGHREEAVAGCRVDVARERETEPGRCVLHAPHEFRPLPARRPADRARAVRCAAPHAVTVVLDLSIARGDVVPAEAARPAHGPAHVIGRQPAQREHPHDARTAAHYAGLRIRARRRSGYCRRLQSRPEVVRIERGSRKRIVDVGGRRAGRRVVAGLDQHDAMLTMRRKPRGQRRTRATAAHHKKIRCRCFHAASLY